ncbi:MAG: hypothetical protein JRI68_08955 [Deltaproteobacteria bacterium]|nr:hypothetical protein [Deltaproteobacteria bacterium]
MRLSRHIQLADPARSLWHLWAVAVVTTVAAAFYLPALDRTGGVWPAPLDDVYIYYGHARSWALGHPFAWFPGNGYSSGATSVLYPLLLAPAWALGLRGSALGIAAAAIALLCLVDLCRTLRALLGGGVGSWLLPPLVMAVPLLDWSWLCGMETALFGALLGRALLWSHRALRDPPAARGRCQRWAGVWIALMVLTRPESVVLAAGLGLAILHGARSLSTWPSLTRALGPAAAALSFQAAANYALTGEWSPAGAVRKLIWSVPYTDGPTGVIEVARNLVVLLHQGFGRALGGHPYWLALVALVLGGIVTARHRRLVLALVVGWAGGLLLVCLNSTARYQNYRYCAPLLAMLLCGAALGMHGLGRGRARRALAFALAAIAILAPSRELGRQTDHFAAASANILEQHGQVARRLTELHPVPKRVLVNDAGAIPYLSEIPPLDGLGLGGFRRLPFARASVHGLPAVVELIERLPPGDRPDTLAVYPGWWGGVVEPFGRRIAGVRIEHNVICAAEEKVIYAADWSTLASPGARLAGTVDQLDVADLVAEEAHAYEFPAPRGGWVIAATLVSQRQGGVLRYDAGRLIPSGSGESFRVAAPLARGPATLVLRTDDDGAAARATTVGIPPDLRLEIRRQGVTVATHEVVLPPRPTDRWNEPAVPLAEVGGGDEITLTALTRPWRSFHLWLLRP